MAGAHPEGWHSMSQMPRYRLQLALSLFVAITSGLVAPFAAQAQFLGIPLTSATAGGLFLAAAVAGVVGAMLGAVWQTLRIVGLILVGLWFGDNAFGGERLLGFGLGGAFDIVLLGTVVIILSMAFAVALEKGGDRAVHLFAVFFGISLASTVIGGPPSAPIMTPPPREVPAPRLRVVHLMLDALQGPTSLARHLGRDHEAVRLLYGLKEHGLTTFSDVHSSAAETVNSLALTLNFSSDLAQAPALHSGKYIIHNAYFDEWQRRGFRIEVSQRGHPDLCDHAAVISCITHRSRATLGIVEAWRAKEPSALVRLLSSMVVLAHPDSVAGALIRKASNQVSLYAMDKQVQPLEALEGLRSALDRTLAAPGGTMVFAHVLLPHNPFGLDPACEWQQKSKGDMMPEMLPADARDTAAAFASYGAQLTCTLRVITAWIDALPSDPPVAVVLHGDHGSRIRPGAGQVVEDNQMGRYSYEPDMHDTFLAVHVPGAPGNAVTKTTALADALRQAVDLIHGFPAAR